MHIKGAVGHRVDSAIKLHELYSDPPPLLADYTFLAMTLDLGTHNVKKKVHGVVVFTHSNTTLKVYIQQLES